MITVSDAETFPDAADSELIQVNDQVTVTPLINVHLTIGLQSIILNAGTNQYIVTLAVSNGSGTANNVTVVAATLNGKGATTTLPMSLGNLAAGSSNTAVLNFPVSAGAPGSAAVLRISETYAGGSAGGGFRLLCPNE